MSTHSLVLSTDSVLIAVFAHPDDESFLLGGTLRLHTSNNIPTYLICVMKDLDGSTTRVSELENAAKILKVQDTQVIGYLSGDLGAHRYYDLARTLAKRITAISANHPGSPITLMTLEPRGVSGHMDHIFVTMVTTYVFYQLPQCKKLMYFCKSTDQKPIRNPDYFVYSPPGYPLDQIDESYDISSVWDIKRKAILCHKSQIIDQQAQLDGRPLSYFNPEHFIVLEQDYKGQKME